MFEKLCLEAFQSGLSWLTILRKRENFRTAYAGFDVEAIARVGDADVERLMADAGIVRNRAKIQSTIGNARRAIELLNEKGSLAAHLWSFAPAREERGEPAWPLPPTTPDSVALSRDLKRRGWAFVGPTTAYAFMQAVGMVDDHLVGCDVRNAVEEERRRFSPPASGG